MNVRFFASTKDGRAVIRAAVDVLGIMVREEIMSVADARDLHARLGVAIADADGMQRAVSLTKQKDGSYR